MSSSTARETTYYGQIVTFIFIFNLVIGVGPLNLPYVFESSGLVLGSIMLTILAFVAYIGVTFVIESMSYANALKCIRGEEEDEKYLSLSEEEDTKALLLSVEERMNNQVLDPISEKTSEEEETRDHVNIYEINKRIEVLEMSGMFMGVNGTRLFLIAFIAYLYGDLAIYVIAVPKTLAGFFNHSVHIFGLDLSDMESYRFFVVLFAICMLPFCFFSFSNTKYLQYGTMVLRNVAFALMIICSLVYAVEPPSSSTTSSSRDIPLFNISGLGSVFGTAVYSFMCHHSIPGLIAPLKNKKSIFKIFALDYCLILASCLLLCISAVIAFSSATNSTCDQGSSEPCKVQDLYTLNFTSYHIRAIGNFLTLFPVFTISSTFPLLAITLRNNLYTLGLKNRILGSLAASIPPILVGIATDNLGLVVAFTGSVGGVCIQYVIPALLVYYSRIYSRNNLPQDQEYLYSSPFKHVYWVYFVLVWSVFSLAMSLQYHISNP